MRDIDELNVFLQTALDQLGITEFKPTEISKFCLRDMNTVPPERIWWNVVPTLMVLGHVRKTWGKRLRINSAYRNSIYNRIVGGGKLSQHQAFRALDIKPLDGGLPANLARLCREQRGKWFDISEEMGLPHVMPVSHMTAFGLVPSTGLPRSHQIQFKGGVGVYNTFVHLDCRGLNASWVGGSR